MSLFRGPILAVADRPFVEESIRKSGLSGKLVARFVAGENLDAALQSVEALSAQGIHFTFDELGENVTSIEETQAAVESYVHILKQMAVKKLEPNISIKLTMLGLDQDEELVRTNVKPILDTAREVGGFVRIDMEGSAYTDQTMKLFESFHDLYPNEVGIVIQTYLSRAARDVERMIERKARVRLVKGAYSEPEAIAYQDKSAVDSNYTHLMKRLLKDGHYPAIATHDPALIEEAKAYVRQMGISNEGWEFQMLYGVRRDEQLKLRNEGYRVRVYVPFGPKWYPYFTRRIAERPANAFFVLRQFISK